MRTNYDARKKITDLWEREQLTGEKFNRRKAAEDLCLNRRTLQKWLKKLKSGESIIDRNIEQKKDDDNINFGISEPGYEKEEDFLTVMKQEKDIKVVALCDRLRMIPRDVFDTVKYYQSKGVEIGVIDNRIVYSKEPLSVDPLKDPLGDKELIFGLAADLHFGSKACQITALNQFVEDCKKEGVTDILVPGDITAGTTVYRGQREDIYAFNPTAQENSCVLNLPRGVNWWSIAGNHDYDFMKANGHNVVKSIAHKREDFNYLGFDQTTIPLLENVDCILWHPSGGVPYALSYRLQKGIEEQAYVELMRLVMGIKEKASLRFFIAGHLHIQLQSMFGPIFGCQAGTFEGTNNYLRRKGFIPNIGGYIIKCCLDRNGRLKEHEAKFKHYIEIENDYKNYKHKSQEDSLIKEPIFT